MKRLAILVAALLLTSNVPAGVRQTAPVLTEPTVRIGIQTNTATVTVKSAQPFLVSQNPTRSVKFSSVMTVDPASVSQVLAKDQIQYRMLAEIDGGKILIFPISTKLRLEPDGARLEVDNRTYRGTIEVFGNVRNAFTVVNELPLEQYLAGVVPNELNPRTFGQIEALKAQAIAARTYIVRNMGQYQKDGYDICATDLCQVYFGAGSEDPLATQAVTDTRGIVAVYQGKPINALYSSTCGDRTESSENIFDEKVPYLVSVYCEYEPPNEKPFASSRVIADWKDAVLTVGGVSNYSEARHFLGIAGSGEPTSTDAASLAAYLRQAFYPTVKVGSDLEFLTEQGILSASNTLPTKEILYRLIDKKGAFEWQQGVLTAWDGQTATLTVNGGPVQYRIKSDTPIFQRIGDDRIAMKEGMWIGGELMDFRAVDGAIQLLVYRKNFVEPSADRYSRLAIWQVHKTRQELETSFAPLNIGAIQGMQTLERGPSERPVNTVIIGSKGRQNVRALRLRSLLGLRDSLFYFDEERNARGDLIGMTFYGRGWGHGVGMCQVGAYGMALDGATYDQILKKYYTGIDLMKLF